MACAGTLELNALLATAWVLVTILLAGVTIPSILTTRNGIAWALSWIVVGALGVFIFTRGDGRKRER